MFYPIKLRVVRFKISDDSFETIITNLDSEKFPPNKIKELYHLRWGVETSFRELKYAIGLISFHSKKVEHITQEIFARLVMYDYPTESCK
jgi:IS4 transposase